jgi:transposase-like protein
VTTPQERLEIVKRASRGACDAAIAMELGCSRGTVRKWRRIAQRGGLEALAPRSGRRRVDPLGTSPSAMWDAARELRRDHTRWGALTILAGPGLTPPEAKQHFRAVRASLPSSRARGILAATSAIARWPDHEESRTSARMMSGSWMLKVQHSSLVLGRSCWSMGWMWSAA